MALGGASGQGLRAGRAGLVVGIAAIVLVWLLGRLGLLEAAELAVLDRSLRAGAETAAEAERGGPSPVVLVVLGEADFARYGHPIPDALIAEAVAGYAALADAVARHAQIVMTELLASSEAPGIPAPAFAPAAQVGFNNMLVDPGRVVRRGALYSWDADGTAHVSLALRLASLHLAGNGLAIGPDPTDPERVRVGTTTLAPLEADDGVYVDLDAGGYQIPLDFRRDPARFESVPLAALLDGRVERAAIEGRVVVVGTDAPSVKDDFDTPLVREAIVKGFRLHAQLADQLIRAGVVGDAPRRSVSTLAETGLASAFGAGAIGVALRVAPLGRIVPMLALGWLLPFGLAAFLFARGIVVPSVEPALAWIGAGGASLAVRARSEAHAQRQLVSLFRRFASSNVADALWRERDRIMAGGRPRPRRLVLTALMSDLVGFTGAAEKLEPEALLAWLDRTMDALTRVVEAHGGHVDDYVGDGIKANFGVPIPSESAEAIARDAESAVACAFAMGRALEACNRDFAEQGLPLVRARIGIATGPAVVGAIGSAARMKYTSVGDTINTAARLESFAEPEPERAAGAEPLVRILIGDETRRQLGDRFAVEDLGMHGLKGKREPIRIHRVLAERPPGAPVRGASLNEAGAGTENEEDRACAG